MTTSDLHDERGRHGDRAIDQIAVERINGTGIFVIDATTGAQTGYIPDSVNDMMPT